MQQTTLMVTLAVGQRHVQAAKRLCQSNWRQYAERHGYDPLCLEEPLDRSGARNRSVAWLVNGASGSELRLRAKRKLAKTLGLQTEKIRSIRANTAFVNSYFLHFGASLGEMGLVNTTVSSWRQCGAM